MTNDGTKEPFFRWYDFRRELPVSACIDDAINQFGLHVYRLRFTGFNNNRDDVWHNEEDVEDNDHVGHHKGKQFK